MTWLLLLQHTDRLFHRAHRHLHRAIQGAGQHVPAGPTRWIVVEREPDLGNNVPEVAEAPPQLRTPILRSPQFQPVVPAPWTPPPPAPAQPGYVPAPSFRWRKP